MSIHADLAPVLELLKPTFTVVVIHSQTMITIHGEVFFVGIEHGRSLNLPMRWVLRPDLTGICTLVSELIKPNAALVGIEWRGDVGYMLSIEVLRHAPETS